MPAMTRGPHVLVGFLELGYFALTLKCRGFGAVKRMISRTPTDARTRGAGSVDEQVLANAAHGVDTACVYFPKRVQCLGRAAAVTRILRRRGMPASFVIGVRPLPFGAHAWVEVNGRRVYGEIDLIEHFQVIDRT